MRISLTMATIVCRSRARWAIATSKPTSRLSSRGFRSRLRVQPKDLILKAELAEFLECTRIDFLRPGVDITVTSPGAYADLLKHIKVAPLFHGLDEKREVPWEEAVSPLVRHGVFSPVIEVIRKGDILY